MQKNLLPLLFLFLFAAASSAQKIDSLVLNGQNYTYIADYAVFEGGWRKWDQYVAKNYEYPPEALCWCLVENINVSALFFPDGRILLHRVKQNMELMPSQMRSIQALLDKSAPLWQVNPIEGTDALMHTINLKLSPPAQSPCRKINKILEGTYFMSDNDKKLDILLEAFIKYPKYYALHLRIYNVLIELGRVEDACRKIKAIPAIEMPWYAKFNTDHCE